ncbi:MAG: Ppx/GppA phosphatase family protein [Mariprofundus sp.]|nr:Ppx/GppA phosphatase family protein [Mariprofundus sp.]
MKQVTEQQRFAAIDIGSNTFRMMIAEPAAADAAYPWRIIHYTHNIIRLGEGLHHSGRLSAAAMLRALSAFQDYARLLSDFHVEPDHVLAVATAAMREAENGDSFRQQVFEQSAISICIIDGESEAEMSLAGSSAVLKPETQADMLLFDIGGASTEFIRATAGMATDAMSRKMGVVRLVDAHLHSDPTSSADYAAMLATADVHLAEVEAFWADAQIPAVLVGTAGTVTTLAATALDLCPYDADKINNYSMSWSEFEDLRDRLLAMNQIERQAIRSIESGRADLIVAGLAIIEAVMRRWHYDQLTIVDAGLLEGAWLHIVGHSAGDNS